MLEPCPHCGAVPSGTLADFPVIIHKKGCPKSPTGIKAIDVGKLVAGSLPGKKFMCVGCGVQWDEVGEAEYKHAPSCPWNPLRN